MSGFATRQTKGLMHAYRCGRGLWGTAEANEHCDHQGSFRFRDCLAASQGIKEKPQPVFYLVWEEACEMAG